MPNIRKMKSSEERRKVENPPSMRRRNSSGNFEKKEIKQSLTKTLSENKRLSDYDTRQKKQHLLLPVNKDKRKSEENKKETIKQPLTKSSMESKRLTETRQEKPPVITTRVIVTRDDLILSVNKDKKSEEKKKENDNRAQLVDPRENRRQETETTPKALPHFKAPRASLFKKRRHNADETSIILDSEGESEDEIKIVDDNKKTLRETPTKISKFYSRRQIHELAKINNESVVYWDPEAAENQAKGEKSQETTVVVNTPSPVSPMVRLASLHPCRLKDRLKLLQEKEKNSKRNAVENIENVGSPREPPHKNEKMSEERGFENDDDEDYSWMISQADEMENQFMATQVVTTSNLLSTSFDVFDEADDILLSQIELPC